MDNFDSESPVFSDPEVAQHFLDCINMQNESKISDFEIWRWLRRPPVDTVVRVNTIKSSTEAVIKEINEHLDKTDSRQRYKVNPHHTVNDAVLITPEVNSRCDSLKTTTVGYVVVGEMCGLAVLRGAHVFAPGILCVSPPSLAPGDSVKVMADTQAKCLKGAKFFEGEMRHVANGILRVSRDALFRSDLNGVGVEITEKLYPCPSLNERDFSGAFMLQNLPSIIAGRLLDARNNEKILDMCASPGGKTTHIAQMMKNSGTVIALDKSSNKINAINRNCERLGVTNVRAFVMDGTKCIAESKNDISSVDSLEPPFPPCSFDRILLDAPCSALGQRPQFYNKMRMKELRSFPKIQRKLFKSAVQLLKPGGVLVYSTCTNNIEENEKIVKWAIENHEDIQFGNQKNFGHPSRPDDTITFFMAKFTKK